MRFFRQSTFLRLVVLPFTLILFLSACYKWVPIQSTPPIPSQVESADVLRVYLTDGLSNWSTTRTSPGTALSDTRKGQRRSGEILLGEQRSRWMTSPPSTKDGATGQLQALSLVVP